LAFLVSGIANAATNPAFEIRPSPSWPISSGLTIMLKVGAKNA
jgi:hypothetical protein